MPQGDVIVGGSVSANSTSQTAPAANSTANFNASGVSGGSMQVTGTFVGALAPEGSLTGAPGDWQAAPITNLAGTPVTSITAPGFFTFNAETFVFFRLRATAWTSGIAAVVFKASPGAGPSGAGGGGGGGASTIADGADVAEGATTDTKVTADSAGTVSAKLRGLLYEVGDQADAAAATDTGTFSLLAFFKRLLSRLTTLLPQVGGRLSVDGSGVTQPVSGTVSAAQSGTWTVQPGNTANTTAWKVDNSAVTQPVSAASLPLPTGAAADATLGTTNTEIGGLTETAPATDTASSGLNGRLQRMAQRMTSLIALLPASLVSGRLDVNIGATGVTQPVSGTVTANQGTQGAAGAASWPVQGAAAAGAALAGNPVRVGISDGVNIQDWKQAVASAASITPTGVPVVLGAMYDEGTALRSLSAVGTDSFVTQAQLAVGVYAYNGAGTSDKVRNNVDVTLLASAARTTTQTSADIIAYNCQGIAVTLDVTATVSTVSLTVTINYKDPASGKYITLLASAVIAAASTTMLIVDPRVVAAANLAAMKPIGRTFQIVVTVGNANSQTYSVGYTLIPG